MSVLDAVVREAAARFGERVALVHGERRVTYDELDALAGEVAGGLAARGVRAGELVALVLPTGIDYVVAYCALARLDAITVGVNPRLAAAERERLLTQAQPVLVIAAAGELAAGIPGGMPRVEVEAGDDRPLLAPFRGGAPHSAPSSTDPAAPETVVYTSGSTGLPKGALFTGRQIAAITESDTGGQWGIGGPQLVGTGLPHVGFMTKLAGYCRLGATMHLLSRWRVDDALALIAGERMRIVNGVAAQIALMLNSPRFDEYDWSAVQGIIVGAGPSPASLVQEARRRFGAPYSIRYSSTESGGLGTLTAFDAPDEELATVGRPRPGHELEIRDPHTGGRCATGTVGRVCLRTPAVMEGYWRNPDATAAALDPEGWLLTDDLGYLGADGCLRITGRISEMFIRGGYNVYPQEVEAVLREHPAIADVAVVPRPDPVMGEIGVAVLVARVGAEPPALDALRAFARERLAAFKVPEAVVVLDALPLTAMDKVDRTALRERVRNPG